MMMAAIYLLCILIVEYHDSIPYKNILPALQSKHKTSKRKSSKEICEEPE